LEKRRRGVTGCVQAATPQRTPARKRTVNGAPLAAAAGTNIAVAENVRYWHPWPVAGAMSHNKQMLQSADAGSNPC
jgi:hypothetical protein